MQLRKGTSESCVDDIESKIQLQRLYISVNSQGLGIGRCLLDRAESEARSMGIGNVWVAVWDRNPKAEHIYRRQGYVRVGEMPFKLGVPRSKIGLW